MSLKLTYRDRARGMMVGLAVGDALGAPVEFLPEPSSVHIAEMGDLVAHFHENMRLPKGVWTDDTEMALCIADSLLACGGYDSYDIMTRFVAWSDNGYRTYDSKPAVDVGGQTLRAIEDFKKEAVVFEDDLGTESAGNGAMMRLAPILIANPDLTVLSCRETHNSKVAIEITRLFGGVARLIFDGATKLEISKFLEKQLGREDYIDEAIKPAFEKDGSFLRDLGGYVVDSFAISLWGFLNFDDFEEGMLAVIRLGGDTDTNGACYGQLAGAYYGYSKILKEWREEVYLALELVEIADRLVDIKECPVIRTRFEGEEHFEDTTK